MSDSKIWKQSTWDTFLGKTKVKQKEHFISIKNTMVTSLKSIYLGLPKYSGNLTIKKKFLAVTLSFHHLLWSSPPGRVSHDFMHPWKFSNVNVSITSCVSVWISSVMSKRFPFSHNFILGNRKKSQGGEIRWVGGWGITVMFLEVRNCQTMSDVWAGVLSWWRSQLFFFHLSGRLRWMPSLSHFKTS